MIEAHGYIAHVWATYCIQRPDDLDEIIYYANFLVCY